MSVRYDPLLARALARDILARWNGARTDELLIAPGRRAAMLVFEDRSGLLALLHPSQGWIAPVEEADALVDALPGWRHAFHRRRLARADAPPDERALRLGLEDADGREADAVVFELHTNRWNALRLAAVAGGGAGDPPERTGWRIEAVMATRESGGRTLRRGVEYAPPTSTRHPLDPLARPDAAAWRAGWEEAEPEARRTEILRTWAWTSTLNVDWILEAGGPAAGFDRYVELLESAATLSGGAWIHAMRWGPQPYPLVLDSKATASPDLVAAMSEARSGAGAPLDLLERLGPGDEAPDDEADLLARKLRKRLSRTRKRLAALQRQLDGAEDPETPRSLGQLLLARKSQVPRGTETVTLEGFDGSLHRLELDPKLDAVANAEALFAEAKRRERALEQLPAEIARAEASRESLVGGLENLEKTGPGDALWALVGGRGRQPAPRRRADEDERLPYRAITTSGGLEIRIGRGAKDNDDLTFRNSAPDDIWLHASQASGAHVILRWGRKDENPPRRDLIEAAIAAAANSGARHSGTVAVVWTRRKYVRKPRKSPPGQVVAERSQTIFVSPDEDLLKRLSSGG